MKELIIDISHWDGDIDLSAWKKARKLWGVIIKVGGNERTLGRYQDPKFEANYKKAKAAGLHIGYYYYTVSTNTKDAVKDAEHMMTLLKGKTYDLPWYMDVEDPKQIKLSKRDLTDVIKRFCDTLINNDIYAGVYMSGSVWLNNVYKNELDSYANWIAWWKSTWPTEAGDIGMWQQGGMRLRDGDIVLGDISGYVDCDWCAIDYPARIHNGKTYDNALTDISESTTIDKKEVKKAVKGTSIAVIEAAYSQLGYYAPDDPEPGSKYGRWMAKLLKEDWLAGPSWSIWWCCMYVSWCLDQGGIKMPGFPTYNTDLALKNGAKKYAIDKKNVQYGDIVIFNWDWNSTTDHIGFATGPFDGVGFPTIEGNVGNKVVEKYRQLGNVAYILRPPYNNTTVIGKVVTSETITAKNNRDGGKLDVDGIGGWNTIIDLQHVLGTVEDGWISGQDSDNRKYHTGMTNVTYDEYGSPMVSKLQKKIGAEVDGQWGAETSQKLMAWLIEKGYKYYMTNSRLGYFDSNCVKALQKALNEGELKNV